MEEIGDGAGNGHRKTVTLLARGVGEKKQCKERKKRRRKERELGFWI